MAQKAGNGSYQSANHHKYTSGFRVYDWHIEAFMNRLFEMVKETEPRTVLDAGCGEGFSIAYLASRDPSLKLSGVDLSADAVAFAEEQFGSFARFRQGSVYRLPFSDRSFDTVICSEVLEHLDDPDRAIAELRRVARNYVIITVPREPYFNWLNTLGRQLGLSPDPGHVNFWTSRSFQEFVRGHFASPEFAWKHIYQLAVAHV